MNRPPNHGACRQIEHDREIEPARRRGQRGEIADRAGTVRIEAVIAQMRNPSSRILGGRVFPGSAPASDESLFCHDPVHQSWGTLHVVLLCQDMTHWPSTQPASARGKCVRDHRRHVVMPDVSWRRCRVLSPAIETRAAHAEHAAHEGHGGGLSMLRDESVDRCSG